jgi:cytochrome c peroxidase
MNAIMNGIMVVVTLVTVTILCVSQSAAQAVVGQSIKVEVAQAPTATIQKMREEYRRPKFISFPKDNPYTAAKAALGKKLYFDTRLSGKNAQSCASCHNPGFGWGDGLPVGVGHLMNPLGRRSPTIINAAFGQIFMWDGRAGSLEEQALGPIQADVEMALPLDQLLIRLNAIPEYGPLFEAAFPGKKISADSIAKAIATYERTIVSGPAPFDAWIEGNEKAISEEAKRGFVLFNTKGQCNLCHAGWNFTDDSFHDIGLTSTDIGRGKFLKVVEKAQYAFKTPGLREINRRGPYMHDGSISDLAAVIEHYDRGGVVRESRADMVKPLSLSQQEKSDLIVFLNTLTSDVDPTIVPNLPR